LRLAWLDEGDADATAFRPCQQGATDVFGTVVTADCCGLSPPLDHLFQSADHPPRRQRQVGLDAQGLPVEVVDHIEDAEAAAVGELVMHEIHRPMMVNGGWHSQPLRRFAHQTLLRLDSQVQLQLAIDAIDALVIPAEALDVGQVQKNKPKPQSR